MDCSREMLRSGYNNILFTSPKCGNKTAIPYRSVRYPMKSAFAISLPISSVTFTA